MRTVYRTLWWAAFIAGGLIVQRAVPGVDALTPGFLLSMQEKRPWQSAWLFVLFVLIQEGAGNMSFGSALLWYGGQIVFFRLGLRIFVADDPLFLLILSLGLSIYRAALTMFMCLVQEIPIDTVVLVQDCLIQAVTIPIVWTIAYLTRPQRAGGTG